jgi:hypothetical protein
MNLKRRAFKAIAIVTASVSLITMGAASAANADVWWPTAADNLSKTSFAVESQENFSSTVGYSTLFNSKDQLCATLGEAPCANVATDIFNGSYVLPVCTSATQTLCLDTVNIYKGAKAAAKFIRQIDAPVAAVNAATSAAGIPGGGATTLWTGADGKTYAVAVEVQVQITNGKLVANTFSAVVNPYVQTTGSYTAAKLTTVGSKTYIDDTRDLQCAWVETGTCGVLQDFDPATHVGLSFRMGKPTDQFLSGRLAGPTISVAKASGTNQIELSIDAKPVAVQQLSITAPKGLNLGGPARGMLDYPVDSTANLTALRTAAGNKASGVRTYWNVNNEDDSRVTQSTKCKAASGIAGVIATDALIADTFTAAKTGTALKQTINGLLQNPDGTADSGSLDLVVADDFARCVFGLSKTGTLKVKATGGTLSASVGGGWLSASLTGIKYGSASTPTVTITK